jgi:hypothetical protein
VSWASRKQPTWALCTVSTSTTEAEFIAAADACKKALWLRNLLHDFGFEQKTMDILSGSTCSLELIRNPVHHSRAKHIDVQHKFVRDPAAKGEMRYSYCPTTDMIADALTNPLCAPPFVRCRDAMGVHHQVVILLKIWMSDCSTGNSLFVSIET